MTEQQKRNIETLCYETAETVLAFVSPEDELPKDIVEKFVVAAVAGKLAPYLAEHEIPFTDEVSKISLYETEAAICDWQLFSKK